MPHLLQGHCGTSSPPCTLIRHFSRFIRVLLAVSCHGWRAYLPASAPHTIWLLLVPCVWAPLPPCLYTCIRTFAGEREEIPATLTVLPKEVTVRDGRSQTDVIGQDRTSEHEGKRNKIGDTPLLEDKQPRHFFRIYGMVAQTVPVSPNGIMLV